VHLDFVDEIEQFVTMIANLLIPRPLP